MFKKSFFVAAIAALATTLSSFTPEASNESKNAENATIYIYRVGQFNGAAANWSIWADGQKICKISNNKFLKVELPAGKHEFNAKVGGVGILKKETNVEIDAEAGHSYYIACNIKQSITRARLELMEVTKSTADKQMAKMTVDNCQAKIDEDGGQ
jgi:hypothetical protein